MRLALASCVLFGCLQPSSLTCPSGTLTCPQDAKCVVAAQQEWCATAEQLAACVDVAPGASCSFAGASGTCFDGVCLPAECRNERIDFGEQCDDGNDVTGDGCSSDCRSNEICGNDVVDVVTGEVCDDANRRAHDGCSNACSLESPAWERLDNAPGTRYGATMTYDADRDRVLMFGGYTTTPNTNDLDDLWEWNGEQWHHIVPGIAPQPRTYAAMTFDAARHEVVLFAGIKLTTPTPEGVDPASYDDTWIWNGATWRTVNVAGSPEARNQHTLVYDAARKRAVLYGGRKRGSLSSTPPPFSDMWEWNGETWTEVCDPCAPGGRQAHAMAYDPTRGVMVMFGGDYNDGTLLDDTWELANGTWTKITPATTTPPARRAARMAFDPIAHAMVLSGGYGAAGTLSDTYTWNGLDWTATTGGSKSNAAYDSGVSSDPVRGEIVAYGGRSDSVASSDVTLRWESGVWTSVTATTEPQSGDAAAAYDPERGRAAFLFTGDTAWETDGQFWYGGTAIKDFTAREGFAMAYDAARRETVMFGGHTTIDLGDTWVLAGGTWTLRSTVGPERTNHGMAFDGTHVVLFGGQVGSLQDLRDDTWLWDGATWTQATTATHPSARSELSIAYDPSRNRVVLFGGRELGLAAQNDLWEWNGSAWTELVTTNRPQPRFGASLAWDPLRQRLVLFGGRTGSAFDLDDTWELDGSTWTQLPLAVRPFARHHHAMAFTPNGMVIAGDVPASWRLQWQSLVPAQACGAQVDLDSDGAIGCADEDCWTTCTPECPPESSCDPAAPRCGDTVCASVEDCRSCAADCGPCSACGDFRCDGTETMASCPGDCTP